MLFGSWFKVLSVMGGVAILLSTAGIFSIMAFTVSRRTHEIGVRVALGAGRGRILTSIFSRAFKQIGLGIGVGAALILFLLLALSFAEPEFQPRAIHSAFLAAYLVVMLCVCTLACLVPMGRALAVEPVDALRAEG